jgi:predicted phage-related endonuclease
LNYTIGASECSAAIGLSPYETPFQWWLKKTNRVDRSFDNEAILVGNALEPALFSEFKRRFICELQPTKKINHKIKNYLHATPDAFLSYADCSHKSLLVERLRIDPKEVVSIDFKTCGIANMHAKARLEYGREWTDEIPINYLMQAQQQIDVTNSVVIEEDKYCHRAIFFALIGDRGFVPFVVNRSQEIIEHLHTKLKEVYEENLMLDIPPSPDTAEDWDQYSDIVSKKCGIQKVKIPVNEEMKSLIHRFVTARDSLDIHEKNKAEARAKLIECIGESYGIDDDEYNVILTAANESLTVNAKNVVEELQTSIEFFDSAAQEIIQSIIKRNSKVSFRARSLRITKKKEKNNG